MCDLEVMDVPFILSIIRKPAALVRVRLTLDFKSLTNSLCNLPDVLVTTVIKETAVGELLLVKTRVRTTSETVVVDEEIQHQRHRSHRVLKVGHQLNIPTMSKPDFSHVLQRDVRKPQRVLVVTSGLTSG